MRLSSKLVIGFSIVALITQGLIWLSDVLDFIPLEVGSFLRVLLFIAVTYFVSAIFVRLTAATVLSGVEKQATIEDQLLIRKTYIGLIYFFATAYILWRMGATLASLTVMLGFVAGGIAFTLREILLSYWVWFMLLRKKPFRIGDYIRIGEEEGTVKHIGTFFVVIDDTVSNAEDYVRIPNKTFIDKSIVRLGRKTVRVTISVPVVKQKGLEKKLGELEKQLAKSYEILKPLSLNQQGDKLYAEVSIMSPLTTMRQDKTAILIAMHKAF